MSSLVMPPSPTACASQGRRVPKRDRSASSEDTVRLDQFLKSNKTTDPASPRSMTAVATKFPAKRPSLEQVNAVNIHVGEPIQRAVRFLQGSRRNALRLLYQEEWDRALAIMEKIERASLMVSQEHRKTVLQQANEQSQKQQPSPPRLQSSGKKTVRFADELTTAAHAEEMDRSPVLLESLTKEELLVLRASRWIPDENLSELWA